MKNFDIFTNNWYWHVERQYKLFNLNLNILILLKCTDNCYLSKFNTFKIHYICVYKWNDIKLFIVA